MVRGVGVREATMMVVRRLWEQVVRSNHDGEERGASECFFLCQLKGHVHLRNRKSVFMGSNIK